MSLPISDCLIIRAAAGDASAHAEAVRRMLVNIKAGGFTLCPCEHQPPCARPAQEVMDAYADRLMADVFKSLRGSSTPVAAPPPAVAGQDYGCLRKQGRRRSLG